MTTRRGYFLAILTMAGISSAARGGLIQVGSPGALGANDGVMWSVVGGPVGTPHGSSFSVTSTGGLLMSLTEGGTFITGQQTPTGSWAGSFPADTIMISTQLGAPVSIVFKTPVYGFGIFLDDAFQSTFTGTIQPFSFTPPATLGTFSVTQKGLMFLGVLDTVAEIQGVTLSSSDNYFAFGDLYLVTALSGPPATAPEPSSAGLALGGVMLMWSIARWRGKKHSRRLAAD